MSVLFLTSAHALAGWRAPFRLATCETLLTASLEEFEEHADIRPSLRDVRALISKHHQVELGSNFHRVVYSGSIKSMSPLDAQKASDRLGYLDDNLSKPDLNRQIFVREIRGEENVLRALKRLKILEDEINRRYEELNRQTNSSFDRGLAWMLSLKGYAQEKPYFRWRERRARELKELSQFFSRRRDSGSGTKREDLFYSSANLSVPTEYVRALMNLDSESLVAAGRTEAVKEWGMLLEKNSVDYIRSLTISGTLLFFESVNQKPGPDLKFMQFDHIAYHDPSTNEPVWLFVYSSQAEFKIPRKRKPIKEEKREESFSPIGELKPVRVLAR